MAEQIKDVAVVQFGGFQITKQQFDTIVHTVAPGLDNMELELFFYECKRRGIHPMDRMIFPIKRNDNSEAGGGSKKLTFQCSIDYLRAAAEDTNLYMGQEPVVFGEDRVLSKICPKTGAGHDELMVPESATVTVIRRDPETGNTVKVPATAFWTEYYPGEKTGFMWRKMPKGQLAKCAEALALRKAFPRKLGGLHANEEVERVSTDIPYAKVESVRAPQKPTPGSKPAAAPPEEPVNAGDIPFDGPGEKTAAAENVWELPAALGDSKVKISLWNEMMKAGGGDFKKARQILMEHTAFDGTGGTKIFLDMSKPEKWSDSWCGRALKEWREKA